MSNSTDHNTTRRTALWTAMFHAARAAQEERTCGYMAIGPNRYDLHAVALAEIYVENLYDQDDLDYVWTDGRTGRQRANHTFICIAYDVEVVR